MSLSDNRGERGARAGRFRLFGVEVRIDPSWLVMALLVGWSLATGAFPQIYAGLSPASYWLMAGLVVVGLGLSLLLHEAAHTLVGRAFGMKVGRITLFLFGGVADLREEPRSARAEFWMALAGPLFSVAASLALAAASSAADAAGSRQVSGALAYLATLNIVLAIFNMTPAFPLDGGRVLRALLWMLTRDPARATAIATRASGWISLAMIALGFGIVLTGGGIGGLWWVLIGFFLRYAAKSSELELSSRRALKGVPLSRVMSAPVQTVPATTTLDAFVEQRILASRHKIYPVMRDGTCIGAVEADAVLKVPRSAWPTTTVAEIAAPMPTLQGGAARADADEALALMRRDGVDHLLLLDGGEVAGIVTLADLVDLLKLELKFRPEPLGPPEPAKV